MKKFLTLCALLFLCVSAALAVHPLIGKWRFIAFIGSNPFYDYVTITTVNTTTKKVYGYLTGVPIYKLTGYYNGNVVFIGDADYDWYYDGYYFTFKGTIPLKKHLGICSVYTEFDASWHYLSATKISDSIVSTETMTLNDVLNQKMLKRQAHLREIMAVREKVE